MLKIFPEWLTGITEPAWLIKTSIVIIIMLSLHYCCRFVYNRINPRLKRQQAFGYSIVLNALYKPFIVLIWIIGVTIIAQDVASLHPEEFIENDVIIVRQLALIFTLAWFAIRVVKLGEQYWIMRQQQRGQVDKATINIIVKIFYLLIISLAALIVMQTLGIPISALLAFGGLSGAAVVVASKDLLANFFGGIIIHFDKPFIIGDYIRSIDNKIEGTVEHIGWRLTLIRTPDMRPVYITNSIFTSLGVENQTRMTHRRIVSFIGIRYDDFNKLENILAAMRHMAKQHPDIDTQQPLRIYLVESAESALKIKLELFTKTTNYDRFQALQEDILLQALAIIQRHGAHCAYPTRTIIQAYSQKKVSEKSELSDQL